MDCVDHWFEVLGDLSFDKVGTLRVHRRFELLTELFRSRGLCCRYSMTCGDLEPVECRVVEVLR